MDTHKRLLARRLGWFDKWMKETGETVPDFSSMRSIPDLPPLLEFLDGTPVQTATDWERRRQEIKDLLCRWILGGFPSRTPVLLASETLEESRERGSIRRRIRLDFDTKPTASFTVEVLMPQGAGPFPVFLTQTNHRRHALIGLSRGYLVCLYPGADIDDQTEVLRKAYPECDWGRIARRTWLGSRALDYLQTLKEADMERVCIAGHSRNGKQSLIATAFDDRIKSVVSSSSGSGGSTPFRFVSESAFQEGVEFTSRQEETADWFHPRIRFFTGREDRLPIDIHALFGLIAPRHCLISTACNDGVETTFAIERAYAAASDVYEFLEAPDALRIRWRHGGHEWNTETGQAYFDWFDRAFGRGEAPFPEELFHDFNWDSWKANADPESLSPPNLDPEVGDREGKRRIIEWSLGKRPPSGVSWAGRSGAENDHVSRMMDRDEGTERAEGIKRVPLSFGEYVRGHFYFPDGYRGPLPVIIWLHPYSYSTGFVGAYTNGPKIYHFLAQHGYGVLAYDQIGFGTRLMEGKNFHNRYPSWSRLGKMVSEVKAAVDCLLTDARSSEEQVDLPLIYPNHIYCLGYSLGGTIALFAAALDHRISGVASFCGFTPLRADKDEKPTGGIRRLWEWHGLQPLLGLFHERESEIPYDYDDLLSLIAPRPCLIVSPVHDRESDHREICDCLENAHVVWQGTGLGHRLTHVSPDDYNRFECEQHMLFLDWIKKQTTNPLTHP